MIRSNFIYVDRDDNRKGNFKRYRKKSFYLYKKVIELTVKSQYEINWIPSPVPVA